MRVARRMIGIGPCMFAVVLGPGRLLAQPPPAVHPPDPGATTGCRVAATVLGGGLGMLVGGLAGAWIERALWDSEDAGVTGLAVGMVFGAMGGIRLARGTCDRTGDADAELRRGLQVRAAQWRTIATGGPAPFLSSRSSSVRADDRDRVVGGLLPRSAFPHAWRSRRGDAYGGRAPR